MKIDLASENRFGQFHIDKAFFERRIFRKNNVFVALGRTSYTVVIYFKTDPKAKVFGLI